MLGIETFKQGGVNVRLKDGRTADMNMLQIKCYWIDNRLRSTIKNISGEAINIKEIVLFAGNTDLPDDVKYYGEGYHMLSQYRGDMNSFEVIGAYGADKTFFSLPDNPFDKDFNILYYLSHFTSGLEHVLLAFTSCNKFLGKFRLKQKYLEVVLDAEDIALHPGETWDMEEFAVFSGSDSNAMFTELGAAINRNHPRMMADKIPTGWCSYYCMGTLEPDGLYKNAEAMAQRIPELEMIQIDAGTYTVAGDWITPRFEDDLAAICKKINDKGVKAGGYFSPFLVSFRSDIYKEHKDWLVKDEDGNPTNRCSHDKDWCILDGTHPEAREYLKKITRYMYRQCGIRYFKLDFISYGALPAGARYDSSKTSVEAFRLGMKAIIEETGNDSFILACNAPFWPTLGLAHGNRSTNDIFRDWKRVGGNALEQFYRNWQHNALWINDPDCILLEKLDIVRMKNGQPSPRPCLLNDNEFEFHKAFAIACGGMILSGDLLYEISDANIEILKKMKAVMGEAAEFDSDAFEIGRFKSKGLICLFNWTETEKSYTVSIEGRKQVFDFWTDERLDIYTDNIKISVPPHGGKVLKLITD